MLSLFVCAHLKKHLGHPLQSSVDDESTVAAWSLVHNGPLCVTLIAQVLFPLCFTSKGTQQNGQFIVMGWAFSFSFKPVDLFFSTLSPPSVLFYWFIHRGRSHCKCFMLLAHKQQDIEIYIMWGLKLHLHGFHSLTSISLYSV